MVAKALPENYVAKDSANKIQKPYEFTKIGYPLVLYLYPGYSAAKGDPAHPVIILLVQHIHKLT